MIALNVASPNLDHIHEEEALYGKEVFVVRPTSDHKLSKCRTPSGAWYGNKGPQGKRGSAVWIFDNLHASALGTATGTVYFNPWANNPAPIFFERFRHVKLTENKIERAAGIPLHNILDLHPDWPREES